MFKIFKLFGRGNDNGVTTRNGYLDTRGYYLAMEKKRSVGANNHSAPHLPYAITDIINQCLSKENTLFVRWDIYSYRWGLHTFKHTSSSRIKLKKTDNNHRHFVRDGEKSLEELQNYCEEHRSKFDLVIFDGPDKRTEVELIKPMLKAASVVVLVDDFSDEYDFEQTVEAFKADGFKALVITNPAPLAHSMKGAIIYRNDNILGI